LQAPLLGLALLGSTPLALLPLALGTRSLLLFCITAGATILPSLSSLCSTALASSSPCLLLLWLLLLLLILLLCALPGTCTRVLIIHS
jgi:hypothetical protein